MDLEDLEVSTLNRCRTHEYGIEQREGNQLMVLNILHHLCIQELLQLPEDSDLTLDSAQSPRLQDSEHNLQPASVPVPTLALEEVCVYMFEDIGYEYQDLIDDR